MALTPDEIIARVYATYEAREADNAPRTYLGASSIGAGLTCARRAWYAFRHATPETFDGRMLRLFQHGHLEEARIVADLRAAGLEVIDTTPDGEQIGVSAYHGLVRGHIDGLVRDGDAWRLLECKTSNERLFRELENKGVVEAKPVHYAQIQVYLGLLQVQWPDWVVGRPPSDALYIACNKNNEKWYVEAVPFDAATFAELGELAREVLEAVDPPDRPIAVPDKKVCLWCPSAATCWDGEPPASVCGSCEHFVVDVDHGRFECRYHNRKTRPYQTCRDYQTRTSLARTQATLEDWFK